MIRRRMSVREKDDPAAVLGFLRRNFPAAVYRCQCFYGILAEFAYNEKTGYVIGRCALVGLHQGVAR